ncbi:MAG: HNH endonuclease signature motif containing protein [Paludibacter sp.]|nr:HNH endonuclease signature motif containing protein [Paludibacter sp.]
MKITWTHKELKILQQNYPFCTVTELCHLIPGKTFSAIKNKVRVLGLNKARTSILTPLEVKEIKRRYPDELAQVLADEFNVPVFRIYSVAKRYGIKKSDEFLNSTSSGRIQKGECLSPETQFQKGCPGATKGLRIEAIIKDEEKLRNWREKCLWKKGNKPYNTGKDGEIRWRKNVGYYFIRIAENNWEFLHRYIWQQKNGEIPQGFNVIFKDGNRRNCRLSNLECISDAELGERNRHTKYPLDLREAIEEKNKLNRLLKEINHEH